MGAHIYQQQKMFKNKVTDKNNKIVNVKINDIWYIPRDQNVKIILYSTLGFYGYGIKQITFEHHSINTLYACLYTL